MGKTALVGKEVRDRRIPHSGRYSFPHVGRYANRNQKSDITRGVFVAGKPQGPGLFHDPF